MAAADEPEFTETFQEFYRSYYRNEIGELARKYPTEQKSLYVDWQDLYRFDPDLADDFRRKPGQLIEYAEEALRLYDLPVDVSLGQGHVRVSNLSTTTDIRAIRAEHRGELLQVQGVVRKATEVRPKITTAAFECQRCGTLTRIPQDGDFQEPHECQGCERQGPFRVNYDQSEFVDAQKLRVQESPEGLRGGETPQSIDVNIEDDITGEVTAGDSVTATGILRLEQRGGDRDKSAVFDTYMEGVTVEIDDEQFEDMEITDADKKQIVELSNADDVYEQIEGAIAPSIYGYKVEKRAMAFQLFSGVTKHLPDGSRTRGDLHILLIGDPGTGKCLAGDQQITLGDGRRRPIREVVEENLEDPTPIEDGVYDTVDIPVPSLTADGEIERRRATKVWKREAPAELYEIRTASGRTLEVTPSHPLFVQSGGGLRHRAARDLEDGEFIAVPETIPTDGDRSLDVEYRRSRAYNAVELSLPERWEPWLARLVGYVIAEGYATLSEDNTGDVRITNSDPEILADVREAYDRLEIPYTEAEGRDRTDARVIRCPASEFVSFLENLDPAILAASNRQRVPESIQTADTAIQTAFLAAYLDAEGHVSDTQRELTAASMSRRLLEDVRALLQSIGIEGRIFPRENGSYRLRLSGEDFERYVREVGFVTGRKERAATAVADVETANTNTDVVPAVGDVLCRIRETLGLSQSECGLPRSTYQHYERGDRNPSRTSLRTIVAAFERRLDRLNELRERVADGQWRAIESAREALGLSQRRLAGGMAVTQTAVSYYERTDATPAESDIAGAASLVCERIDGALEVAPEIDRLETLATAAVRWDRIESIEPKSPDDEWVYDLEVEDTHNYVSEGILSHNSKLLQYVDTIAPRSIYTSGKGSTAAGLTASAVRDDFGDGQQWSLEAGALVLADQGVAAVDELDKMRSEDQSAMHEALEQQSYHPETEVLLADGRRVSIGEFVEEKMAARPNDVREGLDCELLSVEDARVHTVDIETNETHKTDVDRVSRHEAPEEFVRIAFSNGREITVTPEHPVFTDRDGTVETVPAERVEEGAFVPAPRKLPNSAEPVTLAAEPNRDRKKEIRPPETLTPALGEILGGLIAEGHSYVGSAHEIGYSNQDPALLDRMDRLMAEVFGIESTGSTNEAGTVTKRWISTQLYRWFESNVPEMLRTAREKRIPAAVLGASEEVIRRFLVGAFAGDGGVESTAMSFSTASPGLARDYADALSKIGVASRIHRDATEDSWKVYVMGDSTERFLKAVVRRADERYDTAATLAARGSDTRRHHDVLPTSAARELRSLRSLLGLSKTGRFKHHLEDGYGIQVETVRAELTTLRERAAEIEDALADAASLAEVRTAVGWSGRELAEQVEDLTPSAVHYAESGGYDEQKRTRIRRRATSAVRDAIAEARARIDALEARSELRFYRVTEVETVPNEGERATEWVYDLTVEPTNTFVSQGVILHNSISVSKAGINATLKSRCSLLGAANPTYGRFDQYEPIAEQIDLEPPLISRFDLIFTVTDKPDEEEDAKLADHILTTNYAGELNTHRTETATSNFTEEEIEQVTEAVEPTIAPELLRKYVAYAKRNCFPTMTRAARDEIQEFYVDLRAEGTSEDAPVPVTARKLEALVRLAEASARVRLSDTVDREDARRAIEIAEYSLKEIGLDPETGEFDADVIETGTSKSQRDRIKDIKTLIADIEDEYDEGAPVDVVLDRAEQNGVDPEKARHEIDGLKQKGEVYEPRTDHIRTT